MPAAAALSETAPNGVPVCKLRNADKTYARNAITALEGVNLTLTKNSFSAVIGSSGCNLFKTMGAGRW